MNILNTISAMGALAMAATPFIGLASAAHAETAAQPAYIKVADLDFSRAADVAAFKARVDVAAVRFCTRNTTATDLANLSACRDGVRREAMENLGSDQRQAMLATPVAASWRVAAR